jgi:F5/8 type C domain/Bacterial Ig-like domain
MTHKRSKELSASLMTSFVRRVQRYLADPARATDGEQMFSATRKELSYFVPEYVFAGLRGAARVIVMTAFLFAVYAGSAYGATQADISGNLVKLTAAPQSSPNRITLSWAANSSGTYTIYRKDVGASTWGSTLATTSATATAYDDSSVSVGVAYEYKVTRGATSSYVCSGIDIPLVENRGKIILLVDSTIAPYLYTKLLRMQDDLVGDGWTVIRRDVIRTASVASVKSIILGEYTADSANVKALYLFGHIPVPYSGDLNPDGHPDHKGAWPSDAFYGDMDGTWTDTSVNNGGNNRPGDGKYDQSVIPSDIELQIGRVDLTNMDSFHEYTGNEMLLYEQYLDKSYNFKHAGFRLTNRGIIDDNFGGTNTAYSASGWRNFSALSGSQNVIASDYRTTLKSNDYLWSYGCGGGSFTSSQGVGNSLEFAKNDFKTVFTMLFGSYFGDWDNRDSFLRAPLCSKTYTLTSCWAGMPQWFLHHMGIGHPIGYGTRLSQNNNTSAPYTPEQNSGVRGVHIALMGDPTLRMTYVKAPKNLNVTKTSGNAVLNWTASADAVLGYHVYRADAPGGPFSRRNAGVITSTSYTDTGAASANYSYMVKAIKLEQGTGTYFNASIGVIGHNYTYVVPPAPTPTPIPVIVMPTPVPGPNLALNKVVTASSAHSNYPTRYAVDGDVGTSFQTNYEVYPICFTVDLGAVYDLTRAEITWGNWDFVDYGSPASTAYTISTSTDGVNWTVAYTKRYGEGAIEVDFFTARGRYVRLDSTEHGARYIDVREFAVYGDSGGSSSVPELDVTRSGAVADGGADAVSGTVAGTAVALTYTVRNSGTAPLTISGATVVASQANVVATVTTQPTASVAAGGSTSLVVSVIPPAAGAWSFTLSTPNNDANENPYNWTVSGNAAVALAPELDVSRSGALADGGSDTVSATSAGTAFPLTYTLTNSGSAALLISGATSVAAQSNVTATITTQPAASVGAGAATSLVVSVTPTAAGLWSFTLSTPNNDANENPYNWTVSGTATATPEPEAAVLRGTTAIADGGSDTLTGLQVGTTTTVTYTVQNTGSAALTTASATTTGASNATVTVTSQPAVSIAAGNSSSLVLTIRPLAIGAWSVSVSFATNDSNENPYNWTISGTAAADSTPPATPAAPTVSGGTTTTPTLSGTAEAGATVRVYDNGVLIGTVVVNGSGQWTWTVAPPLAAGAHQITVTAADSSGNASVASPATTVTVAGGTTPPPISSSESGSGGKCGLGSAVAAISLALMALMAMRVNGRP